MLRTRRVTLAVAALLAVVTALGVAALISGDDRPRQARVPSSVGVPPDPLIGTPRRRSAPTDEVPAAADAAARRFLRGYLNVLYGRGRVRAITDASAAVRRALRQSIGRVPAAQRQRRPQVADLRLVRQAPGAILATASIDDGDLAVYPIVFALDRRDGRWIVARLADD